MKSSKYRSFPPMDLPGRRWPGAVITKAPIWCSVDLRDGNQSIEKPMTVEQKLKFFGFLCEIGFKEIEIGFPSASQTEYDFTRKLIEDNLIPDDVTVQVLTQSREDMIRKTLKSLEGVKSAIVHLYNSTSPLQREIVFGKSKQEVIELAKSGTALIKELAEFYGAEHYRYEYSPENFSETEPDFAIEIVNAVIDTWKPTPERKMIVNLPGTVEQSTPNVYADQTEYFIDRINARDSIIISLHAHNDRGTAVAATELALLAGAERVEGTLFGNGERTGNADIIALALNLYTQGIDPGLDFSHIDEIVDIYEQSTGMQVHPRHPYAGRLVYTSFSGSHQNAISRGMARFELDPELWRVPYLSIDPTDVGRTYADIVRFNSQSGKGGAAYLLEKYFGLFIPKAMQQDVGYSSKQCADALQRDISPDELYASFVENFVNITEPLKLVSYNETTNGVSEISALIEYKGQERRIGGVGNGLIDSFAGALQAFLSVTFEVLHYSEHAMTSGTKSKAITYVQLHTPNGKDFFGAGVSTNVSKSSLRAIVSAINKILQ